MLTKIRFVPFALLTIACGGLEAPPGSPGNSGGSDTGGSGTGGWVATGGSTGDGGTTGTGGAIDSCVYGRDTASVIPVRLTNATSKPIVLGQSEMNCSNDPLFQVARETGEQIPMEVGCGSSCSDVDSGIGGCPALCALPSALTLKPGESHDTVYSGLDHPLIQLGNQCSGRGQQCYEDRTLAVGNYVFSAAAGTESDCSQTFGSCGECVPDPAGGCVTSGALVPNAWLGASSFVYLDSQYGLGTSAGGGVGGALAVEIFFGEPLAF